MVCILIIDSDSFNGHTAIMDSWSSVPQLRQLSLYEDTPLDLAVYFNGCSVSSSA